MVTPPTLATDRLVLEPLEARHSDGMFRLWSREEVCRHSGPASDWAGEPIPLPAQSPADSDRIIEFFQRLAAAGRGFRWAMVTREGSAFVGAVGFNSLSPTPEVAFHLRPEFWGRGLMREAAEAALAWLATERPSPAVEAYIEPANASSIGLARRLGFASTGELRDGAERYVRPAAGERP
jgi:ribosomal-protein-alanine N-acetyltransferase